MPPVKKKQPVRPSSDVGMLPLSWPFIVTIALCAFAFALSTALGVK